MDKICTCFELQTSTSVKIQVSIIATPALGEDLEKIVAILREKDTFEPKQSQGYDTFSFTEGILQRNTASKEQVLKKVEALVKIKININQFLLCFKTNTILK